MCLSPAALGALKIHSPCCPRPDGGPSVTFLERLMHPWQDDIEIRASHLDVAVDRGPSRSSRSVPSLPPTPQSRSGPTLRPTGVALSCGNDNAQTVSQTDKLKSVAEGRFHVHIDKLATRPIGILRALLIASRRRSPEAIDLTGKQFDSASEEVRCVGARLHGEERSHRDLAQSVARERTGGRASNDDRMGEHRQARTFIEAAQWRVAHEQAEDDTARRRVLACGHHQSSRSTSSKRTDAPNKPCSRSSASHLASARSVLRNGTISRAARSRDVTRTRDPQARTRPVSNTGPLLP